MTSTTPAHQVSKKSQVERVTAVAARVVTYLVYAYLVVVEIILSLGFLLLLFGANPSSGFVEWIYRSVDRAMKPFRGIFAPIEVGITGNDVPSVFETSIIFAMVIYGILAIVLANVLDWLARRIAKIDAENQRLEVQAEYDNSLARSRGYADANAETMALRVAEADRLTGTTQPADVPPPPPPPPAAL